MPQVPLGRSVYYRGTITTTDVEIATTDLNIETLLISNTTNTDGIVVTFKTDESTPVTEGTLVLSANDQTVRDYGNAWWFFRSGLKLSASDVGLRYQITGNQRP